MDAPFRDSRLVGGGNIDSNDAAAKAASSSTSKVRRRNRMITSCLECRRRKLKCDRLHPCTNCSKGKRDCLFLAPSLDSAARLKLAELKERMGTLERSLEVEVTQTAKGKQSATEGEVPVYSTAPLPPPAAIDEEDLLQPTGLATLDAMYDDEADDVMVDLGIKVGKLRLADRVGGLVRPRLVEELTARIKSEMQDLPGHEIPEDDGDAEVLKQLELANKGITPFFLEPGPSFITPRSDMLLGSNLQDNAWLNVLPSRPAADRLLQQYWESCHPIVKIVHRPSLEARYKLLWDSITQGIEPAPSVQAIIFATLFSAAVSMTPSDVLNIFGVDQRSLIESFQIGTESALGKAHFLRSTKTETLQAFVMYLIPMCRETISRAHLALVGTAIRLAECMGLHRDPLEYGYGPVETHIRRLIWYQLCFLDLRTSEVQGPRTTIRSGEFTTKYPLNLNDDDLMAGGREDSQGWTDMTFARIRFECHELNREVFFDRIRLEQKKITITSGLAKIESSRKAMYERYGPILNVPNPSPLQRAALVVMEFLLLRLHITLIHKFYNSWMEKTPDRLVQVIIGTCTQQLEGAITLETHPDLSPWIWYSRAYHNFHIAFLLLIDVSAHPLRRESDRIWRCLDYVFEMEDWYQSPTWTRRQIIEHRRRKAHQIMRQIRDRMKVYRTLRKIKYTTDVDEIKIALTKPPSLELTDPVSQAADIVADFDLNPVTLLPSHDAISQARVRYTQSPRSHFQNLGGIPPLSSVAETQNPSIMNASEGQLQLSSRNVPNREPVQNSTWLQSTWTTAPSAPFVATSTSRSFAGEISRSPSSSEDTSVPEIDWAEWDKMFPPHLNDGNIDFPPQTLSSTMQYSLGSSTMFQYPQFR